MATRTAGRFPLRPSATTLRRAVLVVAAEVLLLVGYFTFTGAEATSLRFVLYPFVWLNVGVWAVARAHPPETSRRRRLLVGVLAGGYFLLLAYASGLVAVGHSHPAAVGVSLTAASPGWGPLVAYTTEHLRLLFVPFRVVGYLALAYLLYVAVLDAAETAVSGLLALVSCVGCGFPVVAAVVGGVAGSTSALVTTVAAYSLDISTVTFVVAVALLLWRPGR